MKKIKLDIQRSFSDCGNRFSELDGKTILITGVTGYFGKWLLLGANHLVENLGVNIRVIGISRSSEVMKDDANFNRPWITYKNLATEQLHTANLRYDALIHAATGGDPNPGSPDFLMDNIIHGTSSVLRSAINAKCERILYVSSGGVYGECARSYDKVPESCPTYYAPSDSSYKALYGIAKLTAEKLVTSYSREYGLSAAIARCFAFSGPFLKMDANFAIGNFISSAIKGDPIIIQGDGTPLRSYLYMSDLSYWLWSMLCQTKGIDTYNVGSEIPYSISSLAFEVCKSLAVDPRIQILKTPSGGPIDKYVPDVAKAKSTFNLHEKFNLSENTIRTAEWYLDSIKGVEK